MGVMDYIFGSIEASERSIQNINHTLVKQRNFNRQLTLLVYMGVISALLSEVNRREQEKKINKLCKEIEELKKHSEGD